MGAEPRADRHRRPEPDPAGHSAAAALKGPVTGPERRQVYPDAVIDGRAAARGGPARLRRRLSRLAVSRGEREEAQLEALIRSLPAVTRPNVVAVVSPKGGVGKTTCAFLLASVLASHQQLRVVAVDANPDFGTLAALAPDSLRSERSLADLLADADQLQTAAELRAYVSALPSGLHLLGGPRDAALLATLGPDHYGNLVAFLSVFYEVLVLDLGTGVAGPLMRFALERSDQLVLVTTAEWATQQVVLDALGSLRHARTTLVLNKVHKGESLAGMTGSFREERLHRLVSVPYDERLALMLDSSTYTLGALERRTRMAVKQLALSVCEQLV